MLIAALKEINKRERRVAVTPDAARRYAAAGATVTVQAGAGEAAGCTDELYRQAGAKIAPNAQEALRNADLLLTVGSPADENLGALGPGKAIAGMLAPPGGPAAPERYTAKGLHAFALELLPRISRAQGMDVLSSQSNLAGYRAVMEAFAASRKVVPMMMTAAGTVPPARVLVLGAGVAGLQAIATAKRLGAVVSSFDVRTAVREQVESLGAKFIEVPAEEKGDTAGGYAKEMSDDYKRRQAELIAETLTTQDIVITTALIPGKRAPVLISAGMAEAMKDGSVIVDMAAAAGGNCELTKPDSPVVHRGVLVLGPTDLASRCATDASALYARNLFNFVSTLLMKDGALTIQWEDELVQATELGRETSGARNS